MRHFLRNDHGYFHKAHDPAVFEPGRLVNHFPYAFLVYGVGIRPPCFKKFPDYGPRTLRVAAPQIASDKPVGTFGEGIPRFFIHENYLSFGIAHGNGAIHFFIPSVIHNNYLNLFF